MQARRNITNVYRTSRVDLEILLEQESLASSNDSLNHHSLSVLKDLLSDPENLSDLEELLEEENWSAR